MSQGKTIQKQLAPWTQAAADNDETETGQLLRRAERVVMFILRRIGRDDRALEDSRQDVLVSLVRRLRSKQKPEQIRNFQAYAARASFNQLKRIERESRESTIKSLADPRTIELATAASDRRIEALRIGEAIRDVWIACINLLSTEELQIFLFDRNDILWQMISIEEPFNLDEIAAALGIQVGELEEIMDRLPCMSDHDLAQMIGIKEQRIHKLRHRMKPLLRKIKAQVLSQQPLQPRQNWR